MAKSQIIKDIANDNVSLESSLKRAIIIATDLGNEKIKKLLSLELYGYGKEDELPEYRKLDVQIKIDYTAGYTIVTNQSISLGNIMSEYRDIVSKYWCSEGVSSIVKVVNSDSDQQMVDYTDYVFAVTKQPRINVNRLTLWISKVSFENIIDKVKQIVFEFLLEADKIFGNLDSLDVVATDEEKEKFNSQINVHIDSLVQIGSNNKIKGTNIAGQDIEVE